MKKNQYKYRIECNVNPVVMATLAPLPMTYLTTNKVYSNEIIIIIIWHLLFLCFKNYYFIIIIGWTPSRNSYRHTTPNNSNKTQKALRIHWVAHMWACLSRGRFASMFHCRMTSWMPVRRLEASISPCKSMHPTGTLMIFIYTLLGCCINISCCC